jgi:hypothetical protein
MFGGYIMKQKWKLIVAIVLVVISVVFFIYCLMTQDRRLLPSIICVILTTIYCIQMVRKY